MAGGSLVERPGRRVLPLGWAQCVALFGSHEFGEFPGAALGRRCIQPPAKPGREDVCTNGQV